MKFRLFMKRLRTAVAYLGGDTKVADVESTLSSMLTYAGKCWDCRWQYEQCETDYPCNYCEPEEGAYHGYECVIKGGMR